MAGHRDRAPMGSRGTTNLTRAVDSVFKRASAWTWVLSSCMISSASVAEVTCGERMAWEGAQRRQSRVCSSRCKWSTSRSQIPPSLQRGLHRVHTLLLARFVAPATVHWGGGGSVTDGVTCFGAVDRSRPKRVGWPPFLALRVVQVSGEATRHCGWPTVTGPTVTMARRRRYGTPSPTPHPVGPFHFLRKTR